MCLVLAGYPHMECPARRRTIIENMKINFNRWLAKTRLIRRYRYLNEVNNIMEEFITQQILRGGSDEFINESRKQLLNLQQDTKRQGELVDFLKNLK